jgi:hypothetical protein
MVARLRHVRLILRPNEATLWRRNKRKQKRRRETSLLIPCILVRIKLETHYTLAILIIQIPTGLYLALGEYNYELTQNPILWRHSQ